VLDPSITPNDIQTDVQTVTYLELMMNYAVDMNRFSSLKISTGIMMYLTYSNSVTTIQNVTNFGTYIDGSITASKHNNIVIELSMCAIILIMIIPLCCVLRKRRGLHLKIFDLIVSIDIDLVKRELHSLHYISNILLNYQETGDVLKINVLEYEDNIKLPNKNRNSSVIADEAVLGLEAYEEKSTMKLEYATER